ncbi:BgtAcSP-31373 [Blumeria graminis f. sp. tritici]|uniref:BgtAcSP-31373 n=2 Tax=Blumeria graminis f. sp. tritici TaxID=62690 RepID=A0A9X9L7Q1_BLUGR|nr:hypothetical protein BGT96224_AcSP31373 [Blumeria graminis f. sp. tritici 96224]VCU38744.1 BgtAcSP-31373 [Blumeria graminis f. sp. tritici]
MKNFSHILLVALLSYMLPVLALPSYNCYGEQVSGETIQLMIDEKFRDLTEGAKNLHLFKKGQYFGSAALDIKSTLEKTPIENDVTVLAAFDIEKTLLKIQASVLGNVTPCEEIKQSKNS